MNNSSKKFNQTAKEEYTEEVYRNNSKLQNSNSKLSSIFNKNISKNNSLQNGGNKDYKICMKILDAFNNNNLKMALSLIIDNLNINLACQDDNGNSILHHLVLCIDKIKECKLVLERLLKNGDVSCIINSKNYKGQTPMLLAVFSGQNSIARKLERAGSNKNIEDNDGNYVITDAVDTNDTNNTSIVPQNRERKSDVSSRQLFDQGNIGKRLDQGNIGMRLDQGNIGMILNLPDETDNISSLGLTPMKTDNSFNVDQTASDTYIKLIQDQLILLAEENEPKQTVSKLQNESFSENNSVTDDYITQLENRYNKNVSNDKSNININNYNLIVDSEQETQETHKQFKPSKVVSDTSSVMPTNDRSLSGTSDLSVLKPNKKSTLGAVTKDNFSTDNDTDNEKITNENIEKFVEDLKNKGLPLTGGKSKIVGWRKLILHSDLESGEMSTDNSNSKKEKKKNENKKNDKDDEEEEEEEDEDEDEDDEDDESDDEDDETDSDSKDNDESEENSKEQPNELKRLINSRKNELHTEVLNNITEMLNKGEIMNKNKPLEASERNSKLIKSYLYKQVSDKNPQLTGMDKILIIQKMSKSELLNHLKKLPDLDQLEKTIEEHIKNKRSSKEHEKSSSSEPSEKYKKENKKENKKDYKSKNSEEDSD